MGRTHYVWVDVLKGLAIILVVMGHYLGDHTFYYVFHMPLFFMLSGFLFSPASEKDYLIKSSHRLLIPYITFLLILFIPEIVKGSMAKEWDGVIWDIAKLAYGGSKLVGVYAVFWFITVLWMATNLFNILYDKSPYWIVPCILIGYLCGFIRIPLPWNIQVVPMAIAFIWMGSLVQRIVAGCDLTSRGGVKYKIVITLASVAILFCVWVWRDYLAMDMKYNKYGVPVLTFVSALMASLAVGWIAILVSKFNFVARILSFLGGASMVIMYLHMPLKAYFFSKMEWLNDVIAVVLAVIISLGCYALLNKSVHGRKLLLGK